MLTIGEEEDLLKDIEEGIRIAMQREGYSSDSIDPIKVNKLAHFAIQDLEVPITYGWYKYGPAPVFDTDSADIEPSPKTDIKAAEESRLPSPSSSFYSPDEYAYYFARDCRYFDRILETETKQYLIEFYEDHAPEPYGELYEQNAQVQLILDDLIAGDGWHSEAEYYYKSISRELTDLYRELLEIDALNKVTDSFSTYSKFLKRVIAEASKKKDLTPVQERYMGKVARFYYSHIWKYAALIISKNTVHLSPGENDDKLLNKIDSDLQNLRGGIEEEIQRLKSQGESRELYKEYQSKNDTGSSIRSKSSSDANIEPWTKMATDAIQEELTTEPDKADK